MTLSEPAGKLKRRQGAMQAIGRQLIKAKGVYVAVALIVFAALGAAAEAKSVVKANLSTINVKIDERPTEQYVYIKDVTLELTRRQAEDNAQNAGSPEADVPPEDSKGIYYRYQANDFTSRGGPSSRSERHIAEYIEALTPYSKDWVPLTQSVMFLKPGEQKAEIKFRIHRDAWKNAGQFKGELRPTSSQADVIKFNVDVPEYIALTVDTDSGQRNLVVVNADRGPGLYKAEQKISVTAITNTKASLTVSCEGLRFEDGERAALWGQDQVPVIKPDAIRVRSTSDSGLAMDKNGKDGSTEFSLAEAKVIDIDNKSEVTRYVFEVEVKTELEHTAGVYKGKLLFTLSNK
jgi:hypothetical protein